MGLNRLHLSIVVGLLIVRAGFELPTPADEIQPPAGKEGQEKLAPIGQFLTITGTVDDSVHGKVNRTALALQARALQ